MQEGKFEVFDLVIYKDNLAKVIECLGANHMGSRQYKIVLISYTEGPESLTVNEYELKFVENRDIILKGKKKGNCTCGAWATQNSNIHADYCNTKNFWIDL